MEEKQNIIAELYRGNIDTLEDSVEKTKDYLEAHNRHLELQNKLEELNGSEQNKLLDQLVEALFMITAIEKEQVFTKGFIIGHQIAMETK